MRPEASEPGAGSPSGQGRGTTAFVEFVRLAVVVAVTALASGLAVAIPPLEEAFGSDGARLLLTGLGAAAGYVGGGMLARFALGRIDAAERSLRSVSAGELLAGSVGGLFGLAAAGALTWPLLLFDAGIVGVPLAMLAILLLTATGMRVGAARGGDLLRFLGVSGRLAVTSPSQGPRVKVVDTSALVDGRIVDVCRAGFIDSTLVVPQFVLYELQGLADAGDDERRSHGRRGLDVLGALQRSAGVALEVAEEDFPEIGAVDAKLVAMARQRGAGLLTVDAHLGRVAEIRGVRVLNLHALAETLRPPVLPGQRLRVRIVKAGKERGQGVGYLSDGTMVVVEGACDRRLVEVTGEVTSILSNPNGRMVFATLVEAPPSASPAAAGPPSRTLPPASTG